MQKDRNVVRTKFRKVVAAFLVLAILLGMAGISRFYINGPAINAKAVILIEPETQKVILAENENTPMPAASMTKMMTAYLILEKIQSGEISWDDEVTITAASYQTDGVTIDVKPGDNLTVRDLFNAMEVASANNAAVALAEMAAGSEEKFTISMNQKANQIGLSDKTKFINASGLPDQNGRESLMTASDVAILATRLISDFPEILAISNQKNYQLKHDGAMLVTTNAMISGTQPDLYFKGVDGLKTGYTSSAGYCFAGTAVQNDKRLISVVMGTESPNARFIETKKLFAYGFRKPYLPPIKHFISGKMESLGL